MTTPASLGTENHDNTFMTGNISVTTETSATTGQPPLTVAQAPSLCRLCNVELKGQTWRAHVKSDGHVSNLRLKVVEPGRAVSPTSSFDSTKASEAKSTPSAKAAKKYEPKVEDDEDEDVSSDSENEPVVTNTNPGKCLFCTQETGTLDDNMMHMSTSHGFSVPFQDCLAVELEKIILYLQFVINNYRECICCGTRRSTVEGAQQHMLAKGHCRFEISPDTEDFYEIPQADNDAIEKMHRDSDIPVRLPSGKLIANRKNVDVQEPRVHRRTMPDRPRNPFITGGQSSSRHTTHSKPSTPSEPSLEIVQQGAESAGGQVVRSSEAILAAQLSRLRIAGVREQQKFEARKRGKLERTQNILMTKNFRTDSSDGRSDPRY